MTKLTGKTIWITGASSGIGEALVYQLAERQNKLILSARREAELERVRNNCPEKTHPNIIIVPLDLADPDGLEEIAAWAIIDHGPVDVLVNNGGISQRSLALDTKFEVDKRILNVNFLSSVKLAKMVLPGMIKQNGGHFLLTSSLVGKFGTPFRTSYSASKHALHGYFDALAAEVWEHNINVTLFCGGYIKTNVSRNAVTGDGSPQNKMDENQANGKSAEAAAAAMISAVERNKREVYFGGKEVMGIYIKRYIPSLLYRIVNKMKIKQVD